MKTVYKLTDQNLQTHGGCQWEIGEWQETSGEGELCGPGWLHCYSSPLVALMLNTIHANFQNPRLWRAEADGAELHDRGLKSGYTRLRLIEELPVPEFTTAQRVRFAILCAMRVAADPVWRKWAQKWLSGADRSAQAAAAAEWAAWAEAEAAAAAAQAAAAAEWAARSSAGLLDIDALACQAVEEEK